MMELHVQLKFAICRQDIVQFLLLEHAMMTWHVQPIRVGSSGALQIPLVRWFDALRTLIAQMESAFQTTAMAAP